MVYIPVTPSELIKNKKTKFNIKLTKNCTTNQHVFDVLFSTMISLNQLTSDKLINECTHRSALVISAVHLHGIRSSTRNVKKTIRTILYGMSVKKINLNSK